MEDDASAVERLTEVKPFPWCGILAKVSVDVQIWCAGEAEAEHGACEVEPEESVVGFGEAKVGVHLVESADDGVWGLGFIGAVRNCDMQSDSFTRCYIREFVM